MLTAGADPVARSRSSLVARRSASPSPPRTPTASTSRIEISARRSRSRSAAAGRGGRLRRPDDRCGVGLPAADRDRPPDGRPLGHEREDRHDHRPSPGGVAGPARASEETQRLIDEEVRRLVAAAHDEVAAAPERQSRPARPARPGAPRARDARPGRCVRGSRHRTAARRPGGRPRACRSRRSTGRRGRYGVATPAARLGSPICWYLVRPEGGLDGPALRGSQLVHAQRVQSGRCRADAPGDQHVGLASAGGARPDERRAPARAGERVDGRRSQYLVAPRGHTQWVRNLRAAGEGRLLLGRKHEPFPASEIADADKEPILRAYLRRWKWEVGVFFGGVDADSSSEELRRIAPDHPIFRIRPLDSR